MYEVLIAHLRECAKYDKSENTYKEAADAIERLQCFNALWQEAAKIAHEREPKWIPVTERLPEEDTDVLVVRKFLGVKRQIPPSTYVEIASRLGDDWVAVSDEYKIAPSKHTKPTHWMPLPSAPTEE